MVIFTSPYPKVDIPTDVALPHFLFERAAKRRDKVAFIDGHTGATRTFGDVIRDSQRVAAAFAEMGLQSGNVVAIYSPNSFDWPIAYYGALLAGGTVTSVNPLNTSQELLRQLRDSGAAMLVISPEQSRRVAEVRPSTSLCEVITFGDVPGTTPFRSLLQNDARPPTVDFDPEDVCLLPPSSGTTGLPKAVMLTHQAIVANICQAVGAGFSAEHDVLINVLPFYHVAGMAACLHYGFATGCTTVLLPRFDLEQMLRSIEKYRVTHATWVPPILLALTKDPRVDHYDLSSLRCVVSGAAPVGRELGELFSS